MIHDNILSAMGRTPLIELKTFTEPGAARIVVKYEGIKVGGSVKTRIAYQMISEAEKRGKSDPAASSSSPQAETRESDWHWYTQ